MSLGSCTIQNKSLLEPIERASLASENPNKLIPMSYSIVHAIPSCAFNKCLNACVLCSLAFSNILRMHLLITTPFLTAGADYNRSVVGNVSTCDDCRLCVLPASTHFRRVL